MTLELNNISMEGDSKNVVDALNSREENWSKTGHLIEDARILLDGFTNWDIHYVWCNANFTVHYIAKLAVTEGIDKDWLGEIFDCISYII
jgi:hypothetical protein